MIDRETVHIPDISSPESPKPNFPEPRLTLSKLGIRTLLACRCSEKEFPSERFTFSRTEVRPFTDKQIALARNFRRPSGHRHRERPAVPRTQGMHLEQQTATSEILGVIASSPTDIQPVLDTVAENAARLCDATDAQIFRVDGQCYSTGSSLWIYVPAHRGYVKLTIGRSLPIGRAVIDRETIHIHDLARQRRNRISGEHGNSQSGTRTFLATPLLREGTPIGVISIRRTEVRPFTDKQINLLETFADQAVIAIENVRLFKELDERTNELTRSVGELKALGEVGQAVSSTLDLETVLTRIVSHAVQLSGTDGGAIYEYDEPSEEFLLRATDHMEEELITALRANPPRLGDGVVGRAAASREPVQVPNILEERAYAPRMRQIARALRFSCQPGRSLAARRPHHRRLGGTEKIHRRVSPRSDRAFENLRHPVRVSDPKRPAVPRDRGKEPADRSRQPAQVGVPRQHVP